MFTTEVVPAYQAVPSGRLPLDWAGDTVLLYTIQRAEVLDQLARHGQARPSLVHSEHAADWPFAYEWMAQQVAQHTGIDTGTGAVFWAWARVTRSHLVDVVKASAKFARKDGYQEALLTLRVPRSRVLFSCFSDWHCVLNDLPCPTVEQNRQAEAAWAADSDWFHPLIEQYMARTGDTWWSYEQANSSERAACHESWANCLREPSDPPRPGVQVWQACLPDLRVEDVVRAVILE